MKNVFNLISWTVISSHRFDKHGIPDVLKLRIRTAPKVTLCTPMHTGIHYYRCCDEHGCMIIGCGALWAYLVAMWLVWSGQMTCHSQGAHKNRCHLWRVMHIRSFHASVRFPRTDILEQYTHTRIPSPFCFSYFIAACMRTASIGDRSECWFCSLHGLLVGWLVKAQFVFQSHEHVNNDVIKAYSQ